MACYKCGGDLYHLFHKNTAQVVKKTNPVVEIIKESSISTQVHEYEPKTPQKKTETKAQTHNSTDQYAKLQIMHNIFEKIHNIHQHYKKQKKTEYVKKQYNEIIKNIEAIKQVNYVENVKPKEIKIIQYKIQSDEEKKTEYKQDEDYNPKISYRLKVEKDKKRTKNKKNQGIERMVKRLEKKHRIDNKGGIKSKNKKKIKQKKELPKKFYQDKVIDLLVLKEFIKSGSFNKKILLIYKQQKLSNTLEELEDINVEADKLDVGELC